jgi:MFS family permease
VLRHPRFARLLAALALSQAGDWLYNLALLAYVNQETHSATWLGLTTAARVAPIVVAGPLGGVLADRVDRRTLMIATDVARAVLMGLLALVAIAGLPVVLAPVLAALATLAAVPYAPSVAVSTPQLVDADDLPAANAARAAIGPTCIVAGPALGAVLLLLGPPSLAFALNGLTFAGSALLVASIPAGAAFRPAPRTDSSAGGVAAGRPTVLADLRAGAHALLTRPDACRLVGADVACSVVYGAQTVLLLLLSRQLGYGDAGYGYVLAGFGVGGIAGTLLAPRFAGTARPRRVLALALLGVAVPAALMAVTPCLAGLLLWAFCCGAGSLVVEVLTETSLQRELDDAVLARAYGIAFPAAIGGIVGGSLLAAPVAAGLGLTAAVVGTGVLTAAYAAVVALPRRRSAGRHRATAGLPVPRTATADA